MSLKRSTFFLAFSIVLLGLIVFSVLQRQKGSHGFSKRASFVQESGYFYLPPGVANTSAITEEQYKNLIDEFQNKYALPVFKVMGKPLFISMDWESPYFGAFAADRTDHMQISLLGGMARAPGSSIVTLAGILCHELGHILAGEPRQFIKDVEWSSVEGMSDFYAGRDCLPDFLQAHPEFYPIVNLEILGVCKDNKLCARTVAAGFELINFFQKYDPNKSKPISLKLRASASSKLLRNVYPSMQCRLDSFVEGARCQLGGACRLPACWASKN